MNYLAHAYLSFNLPQILVGNMISDYVKGRQKFAYPAAVQLGIQLHRDIDLFTDLHQATKEASVFFKPAVGRYAGAFVDVVYDHFLALELEQMQGQVLKQLASQTYNTLQNFEGDLPVVFKQMLPYMVSQNWLGNYGSLWGIQQSFIGVARRARYLTASNAVFELFQTHYQSLHKCYKQFFPAVKTFTLQQLQNPLFKL